MIRLVQRNLSAVIEATRRGDAITDAIAISMGTDATPLEFDWVSLASSDLATSLFWAVMAAN